jgi:protein gp37
MGVTTIEWTATRRADGTLAPGFTFNPWRGCTKVSPGCTHCYAETLSHRNPKVLGIWGDNGTRVVASEAAWREPWKWDRAAGAAGERHRVFCASLADVFEDRPELVAPRVRLFHLINETPNLDWLLLTKRPENIRRFCGAPDVRRSWAESTPPNVWLGTSIENQATADERIPHLLKTPAAVRFLSCEPLLGPVDLMPWFQRGERCRECGSTKLGTLDPCGPDWYAGLPPLCTRCGGLTESPIHWVIVGGESGPKARPMHPAWARSLRDQCQAAGVSYFMKQMSKKGPIPDDLFIRQFPEKVTA